MLNNCQFGGLRLCAQIKRWMRYGVFAALSLSTLTASAQTQAPRLGSASDILWSKEDELSLGRKAYDHMLRNGDIYESPADIDYLSYLGNKIASHTATRLGLTFYLTRSTAINAFASPGGYVGVNAGLVLATDNEHELAGVVAHEVAHVSQEHIARSILASKDRQIANTAAMIASVLLASKAGGELGTAAMTSVVAGEKQQQINDTRRHETEADRVGRRYMADAGFNELGMQTFFGKLSTPSGRSQTPSYLLTHPLPETRQADIDTLKRRSQSLTSRDEYYLFRARIQSEFLSKDEVSNLISKYAQSTSAQIRDAGKYLSALQAMKFGRLDEALATLGDLKTAMRDNRDVQLMRATLFLLKRQNDKAQAIYQALWQRYEGDSVVAYDYAQYLSHRGDLVRARQVLSAQMSETVNPQLHWLYGEILGKLGEQTEQYCVLIRYYRQRGEYDQALTQAQIAAKNPQLDWQSRATFEAQEKELQVIIDRKEEME